MKQNITIIIILFILISVTIIQACKKKDALGNAGTPMEFKVPEGWPPPEYNFERNPLTHEAVNLGRRLFYDGRLSKDGNFPCSSCHQQIGAFGTYDHDLSHGYGNSHTLRNAPPLQNLAWHKSFRWDGASTTIEQQCLTHITN